MSELTPITRKETFLAKVGGQNVVTPTPITREETFLQAIIDNGSGGGGGTGGGILVVHDNDGTLDKTWKEISDAFDAGMLVHAYRNGDGLLFKEIITVLVTNNTDIFGVSISGYQYSTNTENGYPVSESAS